MARDGAGTYNLPQPPFVSGTVISSTATNSNNSDIAAALTQSLSKDGQTVPTANLPMGGYRHTGVANGAARTDYAAAGQVQDGAFTWCGTAGGTANALTLTPSPAITAYTAGQEFRFLSGAGANTGATTVAVSGLTAQAIQLNGAALIAGDIAASRQYTIRYDGTNFQLIGVGGSSVSVASNAQMSAATSDAVFVSPLKLATYTFLPADGRLTLTTGAPVTTSDVTAASTIYYTPYVGNRIALYNGTSWSPYTFTERSLALSGLVSGRPYDVFLWDNAGTLTLELTAWTNDTTRATALVYQDGVLVRSGATTRRYLGTIYTTGATTTADSEANRYVWNYYNRVNRSMRVIEATASWTYSTNAYRQANNSTANQLNFVRGLDEDAVNVVAWGGSSNNGTTRNNTHTAVGLNSTSAPATGSIVTYGQSDAQANFRVQHSGQYNGLPGLGRHYLAWLEYTDSNGTTTWLGGNTSPTRQSGIQGIVRA